MKFKNPFSAPENIPECIYGPPEMLIKGYNALYFSCVACNELISEDFGDFFTVIRDGEYYNIQFVYNQASEWEAIISECLKTGCWNDYLTDSGAVFLFKLDDGIKKIVADNYESDEALRLCEELSGRKFGSIKEMLAEKPFYKNKFGI